MQAMIGDLRNLGCRAVLLKGGHLEQEADSTDLLITADNVETFTVKRVDTHNTHGTGCTLSSAIASYLTQSDSLTEAVSKGKAYISAAIAHADELNVGKGHGPVHHFFNLQSS